MKYQVVLEKSLVVKVEADNDDDAIDQAYNLNDQGSLKEEWENEMVTHSSVVIQNSEEEED